ncbi:hypothetical protein EBI01_18430 [Marinomonas rhizomae]|uniref:DUF4145 domain-containing protein n=1 Tax=Marinomonas rhizomae TaxID=491948 RepID=A0A366IW74_9GAMM|nr:hypothetical protein [Marinomonas rhizomae]RBP78264.1 hypothetical protein DFP80_12152 [Marinomonas rhizomae]RNF69790.1 hypothetical protein EBI01_18430 [Marinomonas rhizomae]
MDWKTFIAQIIGSLAWPLVVVFLIYQLKDRLSELLPRLRKLKHKDTELEFSEKLNELAVESDATKKGKTVAVKRPEINEQFNFLMRLSDISPRSAVLESYRVLETASAKAATKAYPELESKQIFNPMQVQKILQGKVINRNEIHQFNELRKLRNQAAHMEDFELKNMPIEAYIDIALTLANSLENYEP